MATIFAIMIELPIDGIILNFVDPVKEFWIYIFLSSFVVAALVEEALKLWIVKEHVFRSKHFDEVMDGITYTIIASLGFATLENVLYVLEGGIGIGILRAVISVPSHALFSGIMGFYIGKSKFAKEKKQGNKLLLRGLLFAIFYHGTFNFLLFTETMAAFLVIPLMIIMTIHLKTLIKQARFEDKVDGQKKPQELTIGRILRIFFSTILIIIGTGSIIGTVILISDPSSGYDSSDLVGSIIFAFVLYLLSFGLIRKGRKIATLHRNSLENTT